MDRRRPWLLIPAGVLAGTTGWGLTAAGASAATLAESHDTTLVAVGLLATMFAVSYAALQIPAGALVDRWGVRRTAVLGMGITVASYAVALTTPSLTLALVCRTVAGAGSAVGFVAGADLARRSRTGQVGLGLLGGMAIGAGGIGVAVIPALEPVLGWRSAWGTSIAVAIVATLLVLAMVRDVASPRQARTTLTDERPHLLRDPELLRFAAIHSSTFGIGVILSNWAATILERMWGFDARTASLVASLILVTTIISRPLGGYLTMRWPERTRSITIAALVVSAACTVALGLPSTTAVAVGATFVLGMASGLPFAAALGGAQTLRPDAPGAAAGVVNAAANSLVIVGTPLLALAVDNGAILPALLVTGIVWLTPLAALPRTWGRRTTVRATEPPRRP